MKETLEALSTADKYLELYQQNRDRIIHDDPPFLQELREQAIRSFEKTGFPRRREEAYKYTHLEPVFEQYISPIYVDQPGYKAKNPYAAGIKAGFRYNF